MARKLGRSLRIGLITLLLLVGSQTVRADPLRTTGIDTRPPAPPPAATPPYRSGELLVKFNDRSTPAALTTRQALARAGAYRLDGDDDDGALTKLGVARYQVPQGQELALAAELSALPGVAYAEPNYVVYAQLVPNDTYYDVQWAHDKISSEPAWDITTGSSAVTVAVVDTGVDLDHPELQGRLTAEKSFVAGAPTADDDEGHGTHVAGIVAAAGNNGQGVAGMAWQVRIMPVKVLDAKGNGYTDDVAEGIVYAVDNGAQIINVSLGGPGASSVMRAAVEHAYDRGVLVVGAAGNCGDSKFADNGCTYQDQPVYPAAYDAEVLAVAATNDFDFVADFSNQGDYVDLAAPGVGIASFTPDGYYLMSGTSQAAPHVAGLAALMLSVKPSLTPQEIETLMTSTAKDLGSSGWDRDYGAGRINAYAALIKTIGLTAPALSPIANADRDGAFVVDWSTVAHATGYTLQEAATATFDAPTVRYAGSESQASISGQSAGTWYYRVRAAHTASGVTSAWSAVQSVSVGPDAPALHAITPHSSNAYTVTWGSVPAATGYHLQESQSPDFTSATSYDLGNRLSFGVTDQAGGTWYYRVRALNATTAGLWSETRAVTVAPLAPTLFPIAAGVTSDAYTLMWSTAAGADGYRLQEASTSDFATPRVRYMGADLTYTVTGQPGGQWYYRVTAYNTVGFGAASATRTVSVTAAALAAPTLHPIENTLNEPIYTVAWSEVTSATGYLLEESASEWFVNPSVVYIGSATQTVRRDQPIGHWHYRVRAQGEAGDSPWSASQATVVLSHVYLPLVMRHTQP